MSWLKNRSNIAELISEPVNWQSTIQSFAYQQDIPFQEALKWISERTSLQVACEILGVALSPSIAAKYTSADLDVLNQLGDFLWEHGYKTSRLMEHRRLQYIRKGQASMGFSLSRDEYLIERSKGKSKNRIAREQGISGPALFHWLNKWGLKGAAVEEREIEALLAKSEDSLPCVSQGDPQQTAIATGSMNPGRHTIQFGPKLPVTHYRAGKRTAFPSLQRPSSVADDVVSSHKRSPSVPTSVQIPLLEISSNPNSSEELIQRIADNNPDALTNLSRDERMQLGLALIQEAVGQAAHDLAELLGETAASEQVEQYVRHQMETFAKRLEQ